MGESSNGKWRLLCSLNRGTIAFLDNNAYISIESERGFSSSELFPNFKHTGSGALTRLAAKRAGSEFGFVTAKVTKQKTYDVRFICRFLQEIRRQQARVHGADWQLLS